MPLMVIYDDDSDSVEIEWSKSSAVRWLETLCPLSSKPATVKAN